MDHLFTINDRRLICTSAQIYDIDLDSITASVAIWILRGSKDSGN